jgi:hypothetical protein
MSSAWLVASGMVLESRIQIPADIMVLNQISFLRNDYEHRHLNGWDLKDCRHVRLTFEHMDKKCFIV